MTPPVIPTAPMTHTYELTRMDLFRGQISAMWRSRIMRGSLAVFLVVVGVMGFLTERAPGIGVKIFSAAVNVLLWLIFWFLLQTVVAVILVWTREHVGVLGRHTLVIGEEGLVEKTDYNEGLHRWSGMHRVKDSGGYLFLHVTEAIYHQVPKRSFKSAAELQSFRSAIEQRMPRRS
jgi:hypothetical protein